MPLYRQDRVDHWRALAAEALARAADVTDPQVRATLIAATANPTPNNEVG
jgi:hypothetical protein